MSQPSTIRNISTTASCWQPAPVQDAVGLFYSSKTAKNSKAVFLSRKLVSSNLITTTINHITSNQLLCLKDTVLSKSIISLGSQKVANNVISEERSWVSGSKSLWATGDIETVSLITIYDAVADAEPQMFSFKNPINTSIMLEVREHGYTLNSSSIKMYVNGQDWTSYCTTTYLTNILEIFCIPPQSFQYEEEVNVQVFVTDIKGQEIEISYWFWTIADLQPPYLVSASPVDLSVGIDPRTEISIVLNDAGLGVDPDSILMFINSTSVEPSKVVDGNKVTITYLTPDGYGYGQEVLVAIRAADKAASRNTDIFPLSFTTREAQGPLIENIHPCSCSAISDPSLPISADIIPQDGDIDESSLCILLGSGSPKTKITDLVRGKRISTLDSLGKLVPYGQYIPLLIKASSNTNLPTETTYTCIVSPGCIKSDLGASAQAKGAPSILRASASSLDITHWPGKTMIIELDCEDMDGNAIPTLRFSYMIEN